MTESFNPYTPPAGELSQAIDAISPADRYELDSPKGKIEVARSGDRMLLRNGGQTKEILESKWTTSVIMMFGKTKRINFTPLKLFVTVSDKDFAGLLDFYGRDKFMALDLKQTRLINLVIGILLIVLGQVPVEDVEQDLSDHFLVPIGMLMTSLFFLSFTRLFLLGYLLHAIFGVAILALLSWYLMTGSLWWLLMMPFVALGVGSSVMKFLYFRRI